VDWICLNQNVQVESYCECDNEPSGITKLLGNSRVKAAQLVASGVAHSCTNKQNKLRGL
jgi:hypothetical protein